MILLYLRCNFSFSVILNSCIKVTQEFVSREQQLLWHMGDIPIYIMLTSICVRHVPVNKPKHKIVYWLFLCVFLFKSSLNISVQFYL
jgi:hypothetical protein